VNQKLYGEKEEGTWFSLKESRKSVDWGCPKNGERESIGTYSWFRWRFAENTKKAWESKLGEMAAKNRGELKRNPIERGIREKKRPLPTSPSGSNRTINSGKNKPKGDKQRSAPS